MREEKSRGDLRSGKVEEIVECGGLREDGGELLAGEAEAEALEAGRDLGVGIGDLANRGAGGGS